MAIVLAPTGNRGAMIAGIVVGVLVLIAVVAVVTLLLLKKKAGRLTSSTVSKNPSNISVYLGGAFF